MPPFSCMTPSYLLSNRKQLGWPIRNIESERHSPNAPMLSGLNDMSEDSQKRLLKVISIYGNTGATWEQGDSQPAHVMPGSCVHFPCQE